MTEPCKSCGAEIELAYEQRSYVDDGNGNRMASTKRRRVAFNLDGTPHRPTCPNAHVHRKSKRTRADGQRLGRGKR